MGNHEEAKKEPFYKKWQFWVMAIIIGIPICIIEIGIIAVAPGILFFEVILAFCIWYFIKVYKTQKRLEEEDLLRDKKLFSEGYIKLFNNLYVNESENTVYANDKKYGFSQIIDCTLEEDDGTINKNHSKTKGKIKKKGKIKSKTYSYTNNIDYVKQMYINITIDSIETPSIKIGLQEKGFLTVDSKKYNILKVQAEKAVSTFKVIISRNKEKYIEQGTVTKVEHRYIEPINYEEKINELSKLYEKGILTDYEFSTKKQELLDKIK